MSRRISRLTLALSLLWAVAAHAQTVDEIVAKNLQAKGGAQKWQSVSTVKMTGKITVQGKELPLTVYAKRPNLNRQEISLPEGKVVQAFDGTTAWVINPMTGSAEPQAVPGAAADMMKNSADFDGALINYKAKGHTIELVGKETLRDQAGLSPEGHDEGRPCPGLLPRRRERHRAEDVGTGRVRWPARRRPEADARYRDVRLQAIDGIMVPHTVKQFMNGNQVVEMSITSVEFNSRWTTPVRDAEEMRARRRRTRETAPVYPAPLSSVSMSEARAQAATPESASSMCPTRSSFVNGRTSR